jgi:hypothetical protein
MARVASDPADGLGDAVVVEQNGEVEEAAGELVELVSRPTPEEAPVRTTTCSDRARGT